jgi:VanZ family protein
MSNGTRPRWRRPVSLLAWAAFLAGACFVLFLGTDEFSAQHTQGLLTPLLHWLFPDMNANEKYLLHLRIRKTAHVVEYGILALLALQAVWLSVKSAVARMVLTSLLLVAIVATLDETGQAYSSARTGSVYDVLLDLTGAAIALALVLWLRRLRARGAAPDPA